ncbi:MAG: STAS domain-containing protein [Kiritimatiellae bacterium]|nr:STAS domain-containing protein [Kiritimatiellia bacterium]
MNIEKKIEDGRLSVRVDGRLDTNTSPELESELKNMEVQNFKEVVFEFTNLEYISSAGLRVLMSVQKALMAGGGKVKIINPNAMVKGVFDMTGLSGIFEIA